MNYREDINLVVFRQNTEDLYVGMEFYPLPQEMADVLAKYHPKKWKNFAKYALEDLAFSSRILSRSGCQKIIRAGFEYAKKHGYKSVTIVEKPNVIRETSGLMIREGRKIAQEYPGIELWETNIDAMAMWLIKNPQDYGVLVSTNMFGDIISDLCAQLVGGLGFASSANIGDNYAVFEPTHGSAPKYAGLYKVNPMAMLLTVKLMFDWLGEAGMANKLNHAIARVIEDGKVKTYDMGGCNSTLDMAKAVAAKL